MFNDLNQPNQPAAGTPPVDDIFAETDKSAEAKTFSGYYANSTATSGAATPTEIETQKVGLSSAEELPVSSKGKILKVLLIALLIILLIGLGYLVYAKFLTGQDNQEVPVVTNVKVATTSTPVATKTPVTNIQATNTPVSEEVAVVTSTPLATTTVTVASLDTDTDGLTNQEEAILGTDPNKTDTDADGLSDYDEVKLYNTNPLKVDTDGDGLSDYEEIKIYNTDPLKADTDGDGHNDGEEVKNGYNPLGAGKMTDAQKQAASTTPAIK